MRSKTGQFVKGQSGNPSGRPKTDPNFITKVKANCPRALDRLIELVDSKDAKIALQAAVKLIEYGYGKPRESVDLDVSGGLDMGAQIRAILLEQETNDEQH